MNRTLRLALFGVMVLLFLALGLTYAFAAEGTGLLHDVWNVAPEALRGYWPNWYLTALVITGGFALLGLLAAHAFIGADRSVPRLFFAATPLLQGVRPGWRAQLRDLPLALRVAALACAFLALLRPQNIETGESAEDRGIDIVIALDLSESMRALMDPGEGLKDDSPSHRKTRVETAKSVIIDFIGRRKSDRIGVVVFGVAAYILSPPTLDKTLLTSLVDKMELGLVDGHGTAIGDALGTSIARLRRSNARSKIIILLTDGDSNAGSLSPDYAAYLAQTQGVKIYTVQIGNGSEVDIDTGRRDFLGQPIYAHGRDPVNPALLKQIATETGGQAYIATDRKGLAQSMHAILDQLEKTTFDSQAKTTRELFPLFLVPAGILLLLELLSRALLFRRVP